MLIDKYNKLNFLIPVILLLITIIPFQKINAANFRINGNQIEFYGTIENGDAKLFERFLRSSEIKDFQDYQVSLNSKGGNLYEGILIGNIFRDKELETVVKKNNGCYSACAIAFLGGTKSYTTGTGIGRNLEIGANLGFHGYSTKNESLILFNEAIEISRVVNAMILQYAIEMEVSASLKFVRSKVEKLLL
ncbi:MAG: hypothetical protein WD022_11825, partial [Balneolaceae bacterium]